MKKFFTFLAFLSISCTLTAQTVVFNDNFDSYTVGSHLAQTATGTAWTTWNNLPGSTEDGVISSTYAASAPNSLYITGANDVIYPFSNQTSGNYTLDFDYYVPSTGNGAYFNIQHYYNPGIQWSFECYMTNTGTGYVHIGGTNYNFTYPQNTWFHISNAINLDDDSITITINNNVVGTWPFHYTGDNATGLCQLGSIDFYAGAPNNAVGTYYVDNFTFTEVSAAAVGEMSVNPDSILTASVNYLDGGSSSVTLSNVGTAGIDYKMVPTYTIDNTDVSTTNPVELSYYLSESTAIIMTNGAQWEAAIGFPAENIQNYVGKHLSQVQVLLDDSMLSDAKVRIYKMGNLITPGPGEMVYEQAFSAVDGWNTINLTTPYYIDGGDFWIGVYINQPVNGGGIFMDDAQSGQYGNWIKSGPSWVRLVESNSTLPYSWCIKGVIEGNTITPWMAVAPNSGTLNAGTTQNVNVTFSPAAIGTTNIGKLHVFSTDFNHPEFAISVIANYVVSVDEYNKINISVFPNPADQQIQIQGNVISEVAIFNINGQLIYADKFNDNHIAIDASSYKSGTYFVRITSGNNVQTYKICIRH